jgi:hypothetical protein
MAIQIEKKATQVGILMQLVPGGRVLRVSVDMAHHVGLGPHSSTVLTKRPMKEQSEMG